MRIIAFIVIILACQVPPIRYFSDELLLPKWYCCAIIIMMNYNIKRSNIYIVYVIILCLSHPSFAQNDTIIEPVSNQLAQINSVMKRVVSFYTRYSQEKVYLHLDNTGYFQGETIWFAGYVYDVGTKHQASKSSVLYVELVNPSGDVVETQKYKLLNGRTHGQMHLDSLVVTGFYEIRAYTRYMRNWDDACVFSRTFPVFKTPKQAGQYSNPKIDMQSYRHRLPSNRATLAEETAADGIRQTTIKQKHKGTSSVHLYPEGGNLVSGLHSRMAYTVITDGEETCRGITEITPAASDITVTVNDGDGTPLKAILPKIYKEGCVLSVNNDDDRMMRLTIQSSDSLRGKILAYALLSEGQFEMCDTFTATTLFEKEFDRSTLNGGVNQAVVFDTDGHMLCDRLFFVYPESAEVDSICITPLSTVLSPCSKVRFDIQTRPNSKLSFSAIDAASTVNGRYGSIATYMLLGSEVKGYIPNPEYYFEADDLTHRQVTDLLMMIQGWRRYEWDDMAAQQPRMMTEMLEDGLYLKGQLKHKWRKRDVSDVDLKAFLFNKGGISLTGTTKTDEGGKFLFTMPDMEDDWNLQIQTKVENRRTNFWVAIDRHFEPESRFLSPEETKVYIRNNRWSDDQFGMRSFFGKKIKFDEKAEQAFEGFRNASIVLPTVTIKRTRRILGDTEHVTWYDESWGSLYSNLFYNCDKASDAIADRGEVMPTVYEWLSTVNEFFNNEEPIDPYYVSIPPPAAPDKGEVEKSFFETNTDVSPNLYKDGFSYKNRHIIWIINNKFAGVTHAPTARLEQDKLRSKGSGIKYLNWLVLEPTIEQMPIFLDDVKSIYISEDERASNRYILAPALPSIPVTIFLYTHPTESTASNKGLRKTHFQGFTTRETFQMEDYSVLPPMSDFRRTLYWAPNVKTDDKGHATVEFWNNSSCHEMYISAEGVSADGTLLTNE